MSAIGCAGRRLETIEAYWIARQAMAVCHVLAEERQWLDALKPALAAQNPPSPTDMLDLRSVCSAIESQSIDAQADCLAAEFDLAAVAGLPTDKALPQPTSVPFAGHFPLVLREGGGARDWSMRQTEAEIPRWEVVINDHAAAVIDADAARAAATADFLAGRASAECALAAIDVQTAETSAFQQSLIEYNRVIAQCAIHTFALNADAGNLAAALMITP